MPHSVYKPDAKSSPEYDAAMLGAPALARCHGRATEHGASRRCRIALDASASTEAGIGQRTVANAIDHWGFTLRTNNMPRRQIDTRIESRRYHLCPAVEPGIRVRRYLRLGGDG